MSATLVRPHEGESRRWGPSGIARVVAGADTTDGSFSVVEVTEEPGSAAPLHVHHGEAEGFYLVEGTLELTCGGETLTATAGDFVYAPKDVPHTYKVVGDRQARMLLLFSRPGFESFFAEAGAPLDGPPAGPPDPEAMQEFAKKYEFELLGPPAH
jgi:quercetin dioxygenase-like cupin family protein